MGGSSSKARKSKYDVSHSVGGDTVIANINDSDKDIVRRGSKKKKNSVKIKQKKGIQKSKSFKGQKSQDGTDDTADKTDQNNLPIRPVYRKKSSCPSCDAKDFVLGKNRSRSGSEKSLRFSDFNKVLRKTRIYDWEMAPLEIALYDVDEPKRDDICYICEVYTGSHIRACRVCCRAYHDSCLAKIGHPLSEVCRRLIAENMWSCHQCVSLNHLLTQEEVKDVLAELADLDISRDNITEANYLKFCKNTLHRQNKMWTSENEQNSITRFRSVVSGNSRAISYTQFLNLESIRLLSRRCKDSLVHLLTKTELAQARKTFQELDSHKTGVITRSALQASLLANKSRTRTYYPDDSIMFIDEDQDSPVTWADFLRDIAIYILGQRPNLEDSGGLHSEAGTLTFNSCDSLEIDESQCHTCSSDLNHGITCDDPVLSSLDEADLGDSCDERVLPLDSSTTMLDEINSVMDRQHELPDTCGEPLPEPSVSSNSSRAGEGECLSILPKTVAAVNFDQLPSNCSPRASTTSKRASIQTAGDWTSRDSDRNRSSPYNDSRHTPIPWEDVEKRAGHKVENGGSTKPTYRRSEVIPRQTVVTSGQTRALSQVGCRHGRTTLAPAYGNLVGKINSDEWQC